MKKYRIFYNIITDESSECGDVADSGEIGEADGLRDALDMVKDTRTNGVDGQAIEVLTSWNGVIVQVTNGREYTTGECESRSFAIPCTPSTAARIARLFK